MYDKRRKVLVAVGLAVVLALCGAAGWIVAAALHLPRVDSGRR